MAILFGSPSMITSTDNKSQQELMQEFDAVLGGLSISPDPKNPTTIRRVEGVVIVTLPAELEVTQVLETLGRLLGERYLLIISHFYFRGLFRKKSTDASGNWLPIHRNTLRKLGGENYRKLLDYGRAEQHLVKSPKLYVVGKQCNEYMLNQEVFSLKNQQRYELTTQAAIRVKTNHAAERRKEFMEHGCVFRKIAESVDGLTFDYSSAIKYVSTLPDGDRKTYRQNVIEQLLLDETIWSVDRQGRNYTTLVVVPRDIRQFFSHTSGPLFSVDIKSSQPLLHVLLYPAPCPEKKKYRDIVENGRFWDFINDAAGKPYNLSAPNEKDQLKESVFREVFYRHKEGKKGVSGLVAVTFKKEFPILWSELNKVKARGASGLPKEMQSFEAELVRDAVDRIKKNSYPLITIHDCIITTKEGLSDVRRSLEQSFKTLKLRPSLTEQKLTA